MTKGSNVITGRMSRLNLQRFIDRQLRENSNIRANIYETIRRRYGVDDATPAELEAMTRESGDTTSAHLLIAARLLISASDALTHANVNLTLERVTL